MSCSTPMKKLSAATPPDCQWRMPKDRNHADHRVCSQGEWLIQIHFFYEHVYKWLLCLYLAAFAVLHRNLFLSWWSWSSVVWLGNRTSEQRPVIGLLYTARRKMNCGNDTWPENISFMLPVGVKPKISHQMNTMRAFVEVWVFSRLNCSTFCNYHVVVVGKSHSLCPEWNHMQRFHGCIYDTS